MARGEQASVNVYWVQIRSWHAVSAQEYERRMMGSAVWEGVYTRCGRHTMRTPQDDRPKGERSCENCLRLVAPQ